MVSAWIGPKWTDATGLMITHITSCAIPAMVNVGFGDQTATICWWKSPPA